MNYILSDGPFRKALLPFTFTRPVAEIRIGILTIREKWEKQLQATTSFLTETYLSEKYPLKKETENVVVNGAVLPDGALVKAVTSLKQGQALLQGNLVIAYATADPEKAFAPEDYETIDFEGALIIIKNTWDIFSRNGQALQADFDLITKGRKSAPSKSNVERFNNLQQTSFNIWLFRLVYHLSVAIEVPLRIESFGATWT